VPASNFVRRYLRSWFVVIESRLAESKPDRAGVFEAKGELDFDSPDGQKLGELLR
jgi:hypothetical protein